MLRRVFGAACVAGLVSGLLLSMLQQWQIVPLIRAAEVFETRAGQTGARVDAPVGADTHAPEGTWQPFATLAAANVVLGVGFALILAGVSSWRGWEGWRAGMGSGLAGYVIFFAAPSLGLPPSLPGMPEAPLGERTSWWVLAFTCSAAGLWLAVFARPLALRALGIAVMLVPHLAGAPRPDAVSTLVPGALSDAFVRATYLSNALFWVLNGAIVGLALKTRARLTTNRA